MSLDSFASCHISCGSGENVRSSGRLQVRPYFGHFSGLWVTFDVRKGLDSAGNHKVKVKIDGCRCASPIYLRANQAGGMDLSKPDTRLQLKEVCLQYLHASKAPNFELKRSPKSLSFLCEQKILLNLNELNSAILPQIAFSHLNPKTFNSQDVIVKMWFGSSRYPTRIERIKVKQGVSIAELKWMLCGKLSAGIEPAKLDIYDYRSMEKLPETSYLVPHQTIFHCVMLPPVQRDSVIVSLVGQDIGEIQVSRGMTLNQFQAKIKETFGLHPSCFVFIPQAFQAKCIRHRNKVTMSAVLEKSTLSLIDRRRRNLPIVDNIPLTLLKYEDIEMYKLPLSEFDLLSSNLVYAYEVTGPTIPLSFRTSTSMGKGEYSLISERPHAISINIHWSVRTLLKYVEDISHFPCGDISYGGEILPHTALLGEFFTRSWKIQSISSSQNEFIQQIPKIVNS